jgi:hypothetical protein
VLPERRPVGVHRSGDTHITLRDHAGDRAARGDGQAVGPRLERPARVDLDTVWAVALVGAGIATVALSY